MKIHDISVTVGKGIPTWPGDPTFELSLFASMERGDPANVSRLACGVHLGTHVDAPQHFFSGAAGVEALPLDALIGPCLLIEADPPGLELRPQDLPAALPTATGSRVLFKTRNSRLWVQPDHQFNRDFVALGADLARELVARGVKLVGVDYLSVDSFRAVQHPVHRELLAAGVVVVEGLDLEGVQPGEYDLVCLPVKLAGSDGAPARAVLLER